MNTISIIRTIRTIRTMSAMSKENEEYTIISMNTMITTAGTNEHNEHNANNKLIHLMKKLTLRDEHIEHNNKHTDNISMNNIPNEKQMITVWRT